MDAGEGDSNAVPFSRPPGLFPAENETAEFNRKLTLGLALQSGALHFQAIKLR
jgi:hypothetical protein